MRSKWLRFLLWKQGCKTSIWRVENKNNEILGLIKWYARWRQYCFFTNNDIIYAQSCLRDVADFIKMQMDKRKK